MVVGWGGGSSDRFTLCMHVFCREARISSITFNSLPSFPGRQYLPCFGISSNDRTFIRSFTSGRNEYSWTTYQFYEYHKRKKCWKRIATSNLQRQGAAICALRKDALLISGGVQDVGENIKYKSIEILKSKSNRMKFLPSLKWKCYYSTQPHASLQWHTMTFLEDNRAIVVGGLPESRLSSNLVYMGHLKNNSTEFSWIELESLKDARHEHFAFKMGRHIIIGGGDQNSKYTGANYIQSCERYDLDTGHWEIMSHRLPFPLIKASVVVDREEKFAIITGGNQGTLTNGHFLMLPGMRNKMLIYTEEKGFVKYNHPALDKLVGPHIVVDL